MFCVLFYGFNAARSDALQLAQLVYRYQCQPLQPNVGRCDASAGLRLSTTYRTHTEMMLLARRNAQRALAGSVAVRAAAAAVVVVHGWRRWCRRGGCSGGVYIV